MSNLRISGQKLLHGNFFTEIYLIGADLDHSRVENPEKFLKVVIGNVGQYYLITVFI